MTLFAHTPEPPYLAVIFSSSRHAKPNDGYDMMAEEMLILAAQQPGFLGVETSRDEQGFGITVSYWSNRKSIANWKQQTDHLAAQQQGKTEWYKEYHVRICCVEEEYGIE
ncbi:Uncharacterized protein YqjZ [hydrothermal vent metagenome]|uniref:Uncharacterized protein YqjZ n=1 Tax=hydrothermal vent metagenome TaxID=652676 RepID=A0A3B1E689_9ZZZZ